MNKDWLSNKEVLKYLKLYIQGNLEYRELLIMKTIPYVEYLIKERFSDFLNKNGMFSYEDLVDVGIIGLMKAIDRCNLHKEFNFYSYASRFIKNEILKYLQSSKESLSFQELKQQELVSPFNLEEDYLKKELLQILENNYSVLSAREELVIKYLFGIDGSAYKEKELAEAFECTRENINIIKRNSLRKLRDMLLDYNYDYHL